MEANKKSPFLVTRYIKNRSTLVVYKAMIKKGQQSQRNEQTMLSKINKEATDESKQHSPERLRDGMRTRQALSKNNSNLLSQGTRTATAAPVSSADCAADIPKI